VSAAVSGPHRQDAIAERDRVGRLARARELILGVQDGLHLPLAVVTGLASANVAKTALVVAGTAEAAAGAIAKATEAFLAARAEDELYDVEVAKELGEVDAQRGVEVEELAALLHDEGVPEAAARASATAIATSPDEGRGGARSPLPRAPIGTARQRDHRRDLRPRRAGPVVAVSRLGPVDGDGNVIRLRGGRARRARLREGAHRGRWSHTQRREAAVCAASAAIAYFIGWAAESWIS
jgi:VIT1/CCC1 family predicted Fe2+/Mn2+ transporter